MYKLQGRPRIISTDEDLQVIREGAIVYVDGVPVKNEQCVFTIRANVQPVNGKELLLVPEGDRFKEQYFVWTMNPHPPAGLIKVNDRIVRFGESFQVQQTENWGSYTKARMMAIDVGPNRGTPNAPNTAV